MDDPFFSKHLDGMRRMERTVDAVMGDLRDSFGFLGAVPVIPVVGHHRDNSNKGERQLGLQQHPAAGSFGIQEDMFGGMFGGFGMISNMHNVIQQQLQETQNDPNSTFFSKSTVLSYQNTGDGRPKLYEATNAERQANGVREMRKSVRDSDKGIAKVLVGREIGERAQVITKQRNTNTGAIEEEKELVNINEEEEEEFNREFQQRVSQGHIPSRSHRTAVADARRDPPLALRQGPQCHSSHRLHRDQHTQPMRHQDSLTQGPHSHRLHSDQHTHPTSHQDSPEFHGKKNDKKQKSVQF